jgi:uncharacterized membrane protein SpoIIM required for sporulation
MLESLINPRRAEKGPWKMFFIGLLYASLSLILVKLFFTSDPVLIKYSGIIVVLFCVLFSFPFMFFIIKQEEREDEYIGGGIKRIWSVHKDVVFSLIWLFLGFVVAFSFWFLVLHDSTLLNAQIQTYCSINSPGQMSQCVSQYTTGQFIGPTGDVTGLDRFASILQNNFYVMIFTLLFSLIFGAGAIFILAWNATVIAGAVGIFTNFQVADIPLGLLRYMIHGIPEITTYFLAALAGGILGTGLIRNGVNNQRFLHVVENVVILMSAAVAILIIAALIEVYITPLLFA